MTPGASPPASPSEEIQFSRGKTVLYAAVAVLLGLSAIEAVSAVIWFSIVPRRLEAQAEEVPVRFGMVNFPDIVEKDPWLFWQLKPNTTAPLDQGKMTGFISNRDRMRNPDLPVERGSNEFRVLSLGDSSTFGWGVLYQEAYPTVLAELLREALPELEIHVLNAACSGYSTHQGLEMLKRRGLKYRPDVVTIWFGWNDSVTWDGMTDAEHARLFAREHLLDFSATYRVLSYALRRRTHDSVGEERHETRARLPRMPVAEYQARLREMVELARANQIAPGRGARVVLIQGCFRSQIRSARKSEGRFEPDQHQKAMAEVAEQLDVPMLSLCDELYQAGMRTKDFLDNGHRNPAGLRVVADALFALLVEQDMLPEPVSVPGAQDPRR